MESSETAQECRVKRRGAEHAKGILQGDPRMAQTVLPASSSGFLNMPHRNGWIPQFLDSPLMSQAFQSLDTTQL